MVQARKLRDHLKVLRDLLEEESYILGKVDKDNLVIALSELSKVKILFNREYNTFFELKKDVLVSKEEVKEVLAGLKTESLRLKKQAEVFLKHKHSENDDEAWESGSRLGFALVKTTFYLEGAKDVLQLHKLSINKGAKGLIDRFFGSNDDKILRKRKGVSEETAHLAVLNPSEPLFAKHLKKLVDIFLS